MAKIAAFEGFSDATLSFLDGVAANNTREWFDVHRGDYKQHFVGAAQSFVVAIGQRLAPVVPGLRAEPRVNGSIFRLNRDTRFSRDKTPYKTHMDIMWHVGEGRSRELPGFFFRMYPHSVMLGAGMHGFDKNVLAAYREAAGSSDGARLVSILSELSDYDVGGQHYKRVPKGFDADHPRGDLLKHNAMHAGIEFSPLPAEAGSVEFVDFVADHFETLAPLLMWVSEVVTASRTK